MTQLQLPAEFKRRTQEVHGEKGAAWLNTIPGLLEKYSVEWNVKLLRTHPNLSYNFVVEASSKAYGRVFIKLSVPGLEVESEILALKHFDGNGCVRLLEHSIDDGIFLLEKVEPGSTLAEYTHNGRDSEAVVICTEVIKRLHSSSTPEKRMLSVDSLEDRLPGFQSLKAQVRKGEAPFEIQILEHAEEEYASLLSSTQKKVLLHGDLHHFNLLSSTQSGWLAIDPQGVIGDPAFEVAAFIRNPFPGIMKLNDVRTLMKCRIESFSELLEMDRRRILGWSFAQTILASGWLFQDHGQGWEEWYQLGKLLLDLKEKR